MRRLGIAAPSVVLALALVSCGQQTWDAAMQAGEAAVQRGQYDFSVPK